MDKKEFKQLCSKLRKEKREGYVSFNMEQSRKNYGEIQNRHFSQCRGNNHLMQAFHVVWNCRPKSFPALSVVEGFRKYPDLKSFRLYNNMRAA